MWVGGFTVGVCKFDELRLKLGYHRTRSNTTSIFEDADGTLWAGTYNDGLYKYERAAQRVTTYHGLRQGVGWVTACRFLLVALRSARCSAISFYSY